MMLMIKTHMNNKIIGYKTFNQELYSGKILFIEKCFVPIYSILFIVNWEKCVIKL